MHKRKKIKGGVETGGVASVLVRNKRAIVGSQPVLPKKYGDPRIFLVLCTISECTFANAMLDLRASINVMLAPIYKSLNFGDLESTRMVIQLANRSFIQPLGILEDVLVVVNDLIFPADLYVLDMEVKTSGKGFALILGCPFLMIAKTKIDVYAETLSMEFGDNLVQFNIFEAMQHPIKDHSLFGIDVIDELVEEHTQLDVDNDEMPGFIEIVNVLDYVASVAEAVDSVEMSEVYDEESKHVKRVGIQITEIKRSTQAQVATTNGKSNSTNQGRDSTRDKIDSHEETHRCMINILDLLEECMEVFMDDFTIYAKPFDACLENLSWVLTRCIETNLVFNFEKCHFMVIEGIVLGHLVSSRGIEVNKAKVNIITSLPNPTSVRDVHSFLAHVRFYKQFIKNFSKIALPLSKLLQKEVDFVFDKAYEDAFQELKTRLTSTPILQAPN
ncbi:Retrovirus-related Pol polyprotein from transposon 17.6, partial [Mucuna pruriens]